MAIQKQIQKSYRPDDEESGQGIYDDQGSIGQTGKVRHAKKASQGADDTLSNIDRVLADQEGSTENPREASESSKSASADELSQAESKGAGGASEDTEGGGFYNPVGDKNSRAKNLLVKTLGTKVKRRMAAGLTVLIAGVIGSILLLLASLPLKIMHIVTNLENRFFASSNEALQKETGHLFENYVQKHVLPGLSGTCKSTLTNKECVRPIKGNSPVSKLYNGWRDGRLENTLAKDYGIEFSKSNGTFRMKAPGLTGAGVDIDDFADGRVNNLFDSEGFKKLGRADMRVAVKAELNSALEDKTLWKQVFVRYKVWRLLAEKYGLPHCIFACGTRDKFSDWTEAQKKAAFKAILTSRVIQPQGEVMGAILDCMMDDTCEPSERQKAPDTDCTPGVDCAMSGERETNIERTAQDRINQLLASKELTPEELKSLYDKTEKDGYTKIISDQLVDKLISKMELEGAQAAAAKASSTVLSKSIPFIGWIDLAARIINVTGNAEKYMKAFTYAAKAGAMVRLFGTYRTYADEQKTGKIDAEMLGGAMETLSASSGTDRSDQGGLGASSAPLYNYLINDQSTMGSSKYKCDDGDPPSEDLTCPEESLTYDNALFSGAQKALSDTGASQIAQVWLSTGGKLFDFIGTLAGKVFELADSQCDGGILSASVPSPPPLPPGFFAIYCAAKPFQQKLSEFVMNWLSGIIVASPFTDNPSGARTFQIMAGGADIAGNDVAQNTLGAQKISFSDATALQTAWINSEQQDFVNHSSLIARMFSTSSPYSLVSHVVLASPTSFSDTSSSVFGILTSPFRNMLGGFSSFFLTPSVKGASFLKEDPFGVTQYGYPSNDPVFTSDPEQYWQDHKCDDPATIANWRNNDMNEDGDMTSTNGCLLLQSAVTSAGAMFTDDVLTADDLAGSTPSSTSTTSVDCATAVGNAKLPCVAQQFFGYPYAYFDNHGDCYGGGGSAGGPAIGYPGSGWVNLINSSPDRFHKDGKPICIGCSGFVNAVFYAAFDQDFSYCSSEYNRNDSNFKVIPKNTIQAGDLLIEYPDSPCGADNHIAIVKSYDASSGKLVTVESSAGDNVDGKPLSGVYNRDLDYFGGAVRYIGPGST